jgi:hypothetical protein
MATTINADNGVSSGSAGLKESADSSGVLALQTNGTTAVTVDTSQNVGVGAAPVSSKGTLQVGTIGYTDTGVVGAFASSVAGYNQLVLQNTSNNAGASANLNISNDAGTSSANFGELGINSSTFTGTGSFSQAGNVYLASASTDLVVGTYAAKPIRFVVNSGATDAAVIDSSGNVGIGTSSPATKLHVNGLMGNQVNTQTVPTPDNGANPIQLLSNNFSGGTGETNFWNTATALDAGIRLMQVTGSGTYNDMAWFQKNLSRFYTSNTERMRIASTGAFSAVIPSGSTLYPSYWCRAWVNFNGSGTVAASGNVTSVTKNGTGDYTVNFTTAMPDANYSCTTSAARTINNAFMSSIYYSGGLAAGSARVRCWEDAGAAQDPNVFCVSIFR